MKTIERLRTYKPSEGPWAYEPIYWAFRMAEKGTDNAHVPDDLPKDAKYPCRDDAMYIAEACNALPALLAVVEAAEKVRLAFTEDADGELRFVGLDRATQSIREVNAALRAMEGEG